MSSLRRRSGKSSEIFQKIVPMIYVARDIWADREERAVSGGMNGCGPKRELLRNDCREEIGYIRQVPGTESCCETGS